MSSNPRVGNPPIATSCDACGAKFRDRPWTPGEPCPQCGSDRFGPIPVRGEMSDYARADRSKAFAPEDIRFGRLAQWAGFITPKQMQRALHEQKVLADAGQRVPEISALLLRDKLLNEEQVRSIHSVRLSTPGGVDDKEFAAAALHMGAITPERLAQCTEIQQKARLEGRDALPLPLIAIEKRFMSENHILAVLKGGEMQEWGLLHRLKQKTAKEPSKYSLDRILGDRGSPQRKLRAVGLLIVIVLIGLSTIRVAVGPTGTAHVQCTACGQIGGAPANSNWPTECPECEKVARYPIAVCLQCGMHYPLSEVGYGAACPRCRSISHEMLTSETDLDALKARIDKNKTEGGRARP